MDKNRRVTEVQPPTKFFTLDVTLEELKAINSLLKGNSITSNDYLVLTDLRQEVSNVVLLENLKKGAMWNSYEEPYKNKDT